MGTSSRGTVDSRDTSVRSQRRSPETDKYFHAPRGIDSLKKSEKISQRPQTARTNSSSRVSSAKSGHTRRASDIREKTGYMPVDRRSSDQYFNNGIDRLGDATPRLNSRPRSAHSGTDQQSDHRPTPTSYVVNPRPLRITSAPAPPTTSFHRPPPTVHHPPSSYLTTRTFTPSSPPSRILSSRSSPASFRYNRHRIDQQRPPLTLDDLPMEHSRRDALEMLEQRRQQTQANLLALRTDGEGFRLVSDYSRRRFDMALTARPCTVPHPKCCVSPDQGEDDERVVAAASAAGMFFNPPQPTWSSSRGIDSPRASKSRLQGKILTPAKPRPYSVNDYTGAAIDARHHPQSHTSELKTGSTTKPRPDSEPPYGTNRWPEGVRTFNHLRWQRKWYPEINKLVKRYNDDMKVVCGEPPGPCPQSSRSQAKDTSVTSEFLLVPVKQDAVEATEEAEIVIDSDERELFQVEKAPKDSESEVSSQRVLDEHHLQPREEGVSPLSHPSVGVSPEPHSKAVDDVIPSDDDGDEITPWRCWVDDATVSSINSPPGSVDLSPEVADAEAAPPNELESRLPSGSQVIQPGRSRDENVDDQQLAARPEEAEAGRRPLEGAATHKKSKKTASQKKDTDIAPLPLPPPPEQPAEPPIVVEEVEEVEPEPEEEPEPVLPSYICPSSEKKSHNAEIRHWLNNSPFHSANRTMPVL